MTPPISLEKLSYNRLDQTGDKDKDTAIPMEKLAGNEVVAKPKDKPVSIQIEKPLAKKRSVPSRDKDFHEELRKLSSGVYIVLSLFTCCMALITFLTVFSISPPPFIVDDSARLKDVDILYRGPPPHTEHAKMARYLVHKAEWVSMGTLSTMDAIKGFPMVNIIATADSAREEKSSGTLYFYLTMLDYTAQDLAQDNRLTILLSQDQDLECTRNGVDPMEPTCARIMITGRSVKIQEGTPEYQYGTHAMLSRHPSAQHWLDTHSFFLCKLEIIQIAVLDYYGGPHYVSVEDYMNADPDSGPIQMRTDRMAIPASEKVITLKVNKNSPLKKINIEV